MTFILSKIFGLYFLALGLGVFLNPQRFKNIYSQIKKDHNFLLIGGLIALLIGSFVISVHNIWNFNWTIILTLLGWWSFIKGFLLITYPDFINFFSFLENRTIFFFRTLSLIYLVLGLFLLYQAWQ